MYTSGYPIASAPSVRLVFDYYPVYLKLHRVLSDTQYASGYSNYSQEEFDQLVPDLLFSYFSLDRQGTHSTLYSILTADNENPDHLEQLLADKALEIVEEIDALTKMHFPHSSISDDSPFDSNEILDMVPIGAYRMLIEINKSLYDKLQTKIRMKEAHYANNLTHRQAIPPKI